MIKTKIAENINKIKNKNIDIKEARSKGAIIWKNIPEYSVRVTSRSRLERIKINSMSMELGYSQLFRTNTGLKLSFEYKQKKGVLYVDIRCNRYVWRKRLFENPDFVTNYCTFDVSCDIDAYYLNEDEVNIIEVTIER